MWGHTNDSIHNFVSYCVVRSEMTDRPHRHSRKSELPWGQTRLCKTKQGGWQAGRSDAGYWLAVVPFQRMNHSAFIAIPAMQEDFCW